MHVGKCGGIDIDCDSDVGAIVFFARTYIIKISPVGKQGHKFCRVFGIALGMRI
jgi:hypothetical protein